LVENFLDSHADFSLDDLTAELPTYASRSPRVLMPGTVVTLPHRDRTAGFFIARLRRS
jgi:16S rRNA (cytosine967-C5)-methyltransferase